MNRFASGAEAPATTARAMSSSYRLNRDGRVPAGRSPVFGASVLMLVYGEAFWPTYTTGDNTGLIATDSMKNFIQRETMNFDGHDLEELLPLSGEKFLRQVSAGRRRAGVGRRDSVRRCRAARWRSRRQGPSVRSAQSKSAAAGVVGRDVRHPRLQAAAPGRQRVPGLRARRIHDAAGPAESAAAHVARPRMAVPRVPMPRSPAAR